MKDMSFAGTDIVVLSVNSILFKYKYIMIQTIYIHNNITFERDTEISPRLV